MDSEGQPKCGGEGCNGVVSQTSSSLKKAQDTEQEITNAMEEVEKLSKMVSPLWPRVGSGGCCSAPDNLTRVSRCQRPR